MSEAWIDATYLGTHEDSDTFNGVVTYRWFSRNGKHDLVFVAYCRNDSVVNIGRIGRNAGYWPANASGLPDLYAEGTPQRDDATDKPDPADYDDPYDYESAAEDWYRQHGSENPGADALEDWDANANW